MEQFSDTVNRNLKMKFINTMKSFLNELSLDFKCFASANCIYSISTDEFSKLVLYVTNNHPTCKRIFGWHGLYRCI